MAIETLRVNPTNQIESLANSLSDPEEKQLILDFLCNPTVASKIEEIPDYLRKATNREQSVILGEISGWAFEWLAFTSLNQHAKHAFLSQQDISELYQKLFPGKKFNDFFFQGKQPVNTRMPDMIEIRNADKTLQITRIIKASTRHSLDERSFLTPDDLSANFQIKHIDRQRLVGRIIHDIRPDLEEKPVVLAQKCNLTIAVPSNFGSLQSKYHLEIIPFSLTVLNRLVNTITSSSI